MKADDCNHDAKAGFSASGGSAREACEVTCARCDMSVIAYVLPPGCFLECKRCGHIMYDPSRDRLLKSPGCHTNAGVSVADSMQTGIGGVTAGETAHLPNDQAELSRPGGDGSQQKEQPNDNKH